MKCIERGDSAALTSGLSVVKSPSEHGNTELLQPWIVTLGSVSRQSFRVIFRNPLFLRLVPVFAYASVRDGAKIGPSVHSDKHFCSYIA